MMNDNFLNKIAEDIVSAKWMAFGDQEITPGPEDTVLTGEIPPRVPTTKSTDLNEAIFTATRSGASITSSTGELITSAALFTDTTSYSPNGDLLTSISIPGILQTTAFDLEVDWTVEVNRG